MTEAGRTKIKQLSKENKIAIPSLYGACFTQAPFWKTKGQDQIELVSIFAKVLHACADLGIKYIVLPLIEDAALAGPEEQNVLEEILLNFVPTLQKLKLMIVFKSLYPPEQRAKVISHYPADCFSLNFDMGNSASLGWNPEQEITLLGGRIGNVHVDDRMRGGEMVPLGEGAVNFPKVFSTLKNVGYNGNYILQTARAAEGQQLEALRRYTRFVAELLEG
jgi:hexulose-6-phosphate isomerase